MKLYTIKRNSLILSGIIALLVVCLIGINSTVLTEAGEKKDLPIYCVDKDEKVVSISFDAAWGNEDTQTLIDILNEYNVKTTFFVVGDWVDRFPESVKALNDAGHEIMNHSDTHPHMTKLTTEKMVQELEGCSKKIEAITGNKPNLFRPPYGDYNNDVVSTCREAGYYTIQWSVDSLDWKDPTPDQIVKRVTERVKPGSIVLFHNAAKNTPAALPRILQWFCENEYKVVPISEIIMKDNFKIDSNGMQISTATQTISSID